jgi:hypothetical protein
MKNETENTHYNELLLAINSPSPNPDRLNAKGAKGNIVKE